MGRTGSTRQRLRRAARGPRPAVIDSATPADVEAPETRRTALHGHG